MRRPAITLLCGLPGSGKSTWAAARAAEGAVVLNSDERMLRLYGAHMPREVFDARLAKCLAQIHAEAVAFSRAGRDVVIDVGFWKRRQRANARAALQESGATLRLRWFDVPVSELRRRLAGRNAALPPGTFEITDAMLDQFSAWFEPPAPDEGFELERVS